MHRLNGVQSVSWVITLKQASSGSMIVMALIHGCENHVFVEVEQKPKVFKSFIQHFYSLSKCLSTMIYFLY